MFRVTNEVIDKQGLKLVFKQKTHLVIILINLTKFFLPLTFENFIKRISKITMIETFKRGFGSQRNIENGASAQKKHDWQIEQHAARAVIS